MPLSSHSLKYPNLKIKEIKPFSYHSLVTDVTEEERGGILQVREWPLEDNIIEKVFEEVFSGDT